MAEGSARGATSCRRMSQLNATPSSANTAPVMGQNQWNAWVVSERGGGGNRGERGVSMGGRRVGGEGGIRIWGTRHSKDMRHATLAQGITQGVLKEHGATS